MKLPDMIGSCKQSDAFFYTACDQQYFDDFAVTLINSIARNTGMGVHVHIFNPRDDQIKWCQQQSRLSVTYEHAPLELFEQSARRWASVPRDPVEKNFYDRTQNAMLKGRDASIQERMQKTYFACARFIRLAEIFDATQTAVAIDVDAVIRKPVPQLAADCDFYIHHISGKRARYLAGGLYLFPTAICRKFLKNYAQQLLTYFEKDYVYWGLDQDLLDHVVPGYKHGQLPMSLIDWNMAPDSAIWTAKGTRKENQIFINEKQKYTF
jgi:hypothetical protein